MKNKTRKILIALLAVVFLGSCGMIAYRQYEEQEAQRAYEEAQALAATKAEEEAAAKAAAEAAAKAAAEAAAKAAAEAVPPQEPLEENALFLMELDLAALRETNEDVLGWIHIPDTAIDFPLMDSADNADYLNMTWDGRKSSLGSIFLECMNQPDLNDFNTLIYGHNIKGGKMFGSLHYYRDQSYRDKHPLVYIATDDGVHRYEIFSAYEASVKSDTYRLYFEDDARKQSCLDYYKSSSVWSVDTELAVDDHILTLSTCTGTGYYSTRWVVQAVQTGLFTEAAA